MSGFDVALTALKAGQPVRREAWAAGCFAVLVPGSAITVEPDRPLGQAAPHLVGSRARYAPHIDMCVLVDGRPHLTPRTFGDQDLLADDWTVVGS